MVFSNSSSSSIIKSYVPYPSEFDSRCFYCHGPIRRVYATSGHTYQDFVGKIREVRGQYMCENDMCPASIHPLNPTPIEVIPYKRYSLNVWRWVAQEYKIFHQNAAQIVTRIAYEFGITFKEEQIQRIMDEIDVMLSIEIDEKTKELLEDQGMILLGLDGQKPDNDGNALWLFVDLISNRILKVIVLKNADAETLHEIIENFLSIYQVKLIGIVSDKQNNITNLHDTYYPKIPHQYCQFHFLQNLWNHIEVKDSHLHKSLEKMVNDLTILKISTSIKVEIDELGFNSIRMLFTPIEVDLRRILRTHTTKFSKFRGIQTYERLQAYLIHLEELVEQGNQESRLILLLNKTIETIKSTLENEKSTYETCCVLFTRFQAIQSLLNQNQDQKTHIEAVDQYFSELWKHLSSNPECPPQKSLRTFLPQYNTLLEEIEREWVRLYHSYKPGLFCYFEFPVPVKTSSLLEAYIGQEKGEFRRRSGKSHVGYMVRTRGEFALKELFAGKEEIQEIINGLGDLHDHYQIKLGLQQLSQRKAEETMDWGSSVDNFNGWKSMGHILASKTTNQKKGRKKK